MKNNTKNVIEATDERIALLQQMSHEFHMLYGEAMKEYGDKELKLIDDVLNFGYKIIQTVGIVAGFGFTALGYVKNIYLFVSGEGILLLSIVYGVYKIKKIYSENLSSIQSSSDSKSKVFIEKSNIFQEIIPKAVKEKVIDMADFQSKLDAVDQKLLKEFSPDKKSKKDEDFLTPLIVFLVLGGGALLLSFICPKLNFLIF